MAMTKKRQTEILWLASEGGDERGAVMKEAEALFATKSYKAGQALFDKFQRKVDQQIDRFITSCKDPKELHFFFRNWNWDGKVKPLLKLIKNPHVDAGTLLHIYWYGCPEDYYLFHRSASELDAGYERDTYTILRRVERRMVTGDYKTASIPFDPTNRISMWDRREEFARQIPDIMYQPITGRQRIQAKKTKRKKKK